MTSRIPDPSDPYEDEGLATDESGEPGKRITGDPQDDFVVPGDQPGASVDFGTTAEEEAAGESFDTRLSREEPDVSESDPLDDSEGADSPYPSDPEERIGRLVEPDQGGASDTEKDEIAEDVGTDLGGFTAEERAMHIEPDA